MFAVESRLVLLYITCLFALAVHRGEFVAIIGTSGSGKSSLLYLPDLLHHPIWSADEPTGTLDAIASESANDPERSCA